MTGERTNDEIEVVTATGPGRPVSRRPMPLGDWILSQTVTVNDDDDDDDDDEQELRDLRVQEAALIESVRLLRQQQSWLAGLDEQLTGLAQMVAGQEDITPAEPDLPEHILTLDAAAGIAGLTPESLLNRIYASGGKRIWAQCGRLPGKTPRYDRDRFCEWLKSPANRSPARDGKKRKR